MSKKFQIFFLAFLLAFLILAPSAAAQDFGFEYADSLDLGTTDVRSTAIQVINVALGFLGIVCLVLIIYGGFLWFTAGGDEEKITKAKKTLTSAIIGLVIILASYGIVRFVLGEVSSSLGGRQGSLETSTGTVPCVDEDGDTYTDYSCGGTDCDDTNPAINPGVEEVCSDGIDNNCNGDIDGDDSDCLGVPGPDDQDGDGVIDGEDNCPIVYNPNQADFNQDGEGAACDQEIAFLSYRDGEYLPGHDQEAGFNTNAIYFTDLDPSHTPADAVRFTTDRVFYNHFAISPDHTKLAFNFVDEDLVGDGLDINDHKELRIADLESGETWAGLDKWPISGEYNAGWGGLDWSPDSQYIYASMSLGSITQNDIYKIDIYGGMINLTADIIWPESECVQPGNSKWMTDAALTPDGDKLAFITSLRKLDGELCVGEHKTRVGTADLDEAGLITDARILTDGGPHPPGWVGSWGAGDFDPEFSPDGQQVVFQRAERDQGYNCGMSEADILTIGVDDPLAGGTLITPPPTPGLDSTYGIPDWSDWPENNLIIMSEWHSTGTTPCIQSLAVTDPLDTSSIRRLNSGGSSHGRWVPSLRGETGEVHPPIARVEVDIDPDDNFPIDTLVFDSPVREPVVLHISDQVYAIAYRQDDSHQGFIKTIEIGSDGEMPDEVIDTLEFDEEAGYIDFVHIIDNIYTVAYKGPGSAGVIKTIEIRPDGRMSQENAIKDTFEFDEDYCRYPVVAHITGDIYTIAYVNGIDRGIIRTVEILPSGDVADNIIAHFEFDRGVSYPDITQVSGSIYAITYGQARPPNTYGLLTTLEITPTGQFPQGIISSMTFDLDKGIRPDIIHLSEDIYGIAYASGGEWIGTFKTIQIDPSGQLDPSEAIKGTLVFGEPFTIDPNMIYLTDNIYIIAYSTYVGSLGPGHIKVIQVEPDGQIDPDTAIMDSVVFDSIRGGDVPEVIPVSSSIYAVVYSGPEEVGFVKTIEIVSE